MMAELAATPEARDRLRRRTTAEDVARLEGWIEEIKGRVEIAPRFVMPGDSVAGAAFDLARTVIRRAERLVARLVHEGHLTNREILRYLNRASDLAFVIARLEDASASG
jgi:cob(I)alamin adenosyltransferase